MVRDIDTRVIKKEVKIQSIKPKTRKTGQFFIQIPKDIARELKIRKGNKAIVELDLSDKSKYIVKLRKAK
jgi:hypothetical protein